MLLVDTGSQAARQISTSGFPWRRSSLMLCTENTSGVCCSSTYVVQYRPGAIASSWGKHITRWDTHIPLTPLPHRSCSRVRKLPLKLADSLVAFAKRHSLVVVAKGYHALSTYCTSRCMTTCSPADQPLPLPSPTKKGRRISVQEPASGRSTAYLLQ